MEIQDHPNYLIYPDGRVWSIPRANANVGRFLRPAVDREGYRQVGLYENGKCFMRKVHRLVAQHYIPNPENKPTVDHIDRNPANNHVSNLRWATGVEQQANTGIQSNNSTGHTWISKHTRHPRKGSYDVYSFYRSDFKRRGIVRKNFTSKIDCICYKYISLLKIKAGVI